MVQCEEEMYREISPIPRLARYVECYWTRSSTPEVHNNLILPDGCADILLGRTDQNASLTLVGLMTQAQSLDVPAGLSYFGVRFRPGMAEHFVPGVAQLNDRRVPLAELTQSAELLDRLCDCGKADQMAAVMDECLRPEKEIDAGSEMVLQLSSATTSIDELAAQSNWSARHFRRRCLSQVGVSPKFLSRILRFRKATERIAKIRSGQPNWAQFAVACGYYDQAHFIREFQSFTGSTPARFLNAHRPPETSRKVPVT